MGEFEAKKEEGLRLFSQGRQEEALTVFETAVSLSQKLGNEAGQAEMLNNIGVIQRVRGKFDEAQAAFTQAEAIFSRLGDEAGQGQVLGNLGDLYVSWRKKEDAAQSYGRAAAFLAQSGDHEQQSQVLRALSLLRVRQGRWLEAMMHMEESLSIRPRLTLWQRLFRLFLRFALGIAGAAR